MEWADNRKSVGRNLLEYPVCDRFTFLCLNWMKELSAFTTTDARNEASVILAKKIFEHDIEFPVLEEKQGETRKYPELNGLNANEVAAVFSVSGRRCGKWVSGISLKTSEGTSYFTTEFYQICNEVASGCRKEKSETFLD
jgi:hypothetical protein